MTTQRECVLMGGGGVDFQNAIIDLYILAQSKRPNPIVMFAPAASMDNSGYIDYFKRAFERYPCRVAILATSDLPTSDLEDYVMQADIIYAGAGNTKNALGLWREWSLDKIFKKAYDSGIIWAGGSAGMACVMQEAITDSLGGLSVEKCLGILPYSGCAHYSSRVRRKVYKTAVYNGRIGSGYAADEGAALHFVNEELFRSISNMQDAKAFKVGMVKGKLEHKRLDTIWLNEDSNAERFVWDTDLFRLMTRKRREEKRQEQEEENARLLNGTNE